MSSREFDDASSQYLYVNSAPIASPGYPVSVSAWVKVDDTSGYKTIWYCGDKDTTDNQRLWLAINDNVAWFRIQGGSQAQLQSTDTISANTWAHIAITGGSGGNDWNIYVDGGTPVNSTSAGSTSATHDRTAIGASADGSVGQYMDGSIFCVAVWSSELSSANISTLAGGGSPWDVDAANLAAIWALQSDDNDTYGGTYNMTASGSPTWDSDEPSCTCAESTGGVVPQIAAFLRMMRG